MAKSVCSHFSSRKKTTFHTDSYSSKVLSFQTFLQKEIYLHKYGAVTQWNIVL